MSGLRRDIGMIGQVISHYRIDSELGRGGMGVVYKAEDLTLKRMVALKFLSPHLLAQEQHKKRFLREARAAAALDHPNISAIYEVDESDGHTFMVMAFIEGESLGKKTESQPLEIEEALDIAVQVARGLSKAHGEGIVHRDIKPGNVLITPDGQAKVVDFGLAKFARQTQITKPGMMMGTVRYMSPEQATGAEVDHRTDIWSLGVMLYEILAGQLPFRGEMDPAIVYSILNEDPPSVTKVRGDVPVAVEEIIEKALAKDPSSRYQSIDDMLAALETQLDQLTLGIKERRFNLLRKLRRRKKLGVFSAAIVVTVVVTATGLWWAGLPPFAARAAFTSIAVLPFEYTGPGVEDSDWMVGGIGQELATKLAHLKNVRVLSWTSSRNFNTQEMSPREIADSLGVEAIVTGSLHMVGERFRGVVSLVDGETEFQHWTGEFNEPRGDIFAVQKEIALGVAMGLMGRLTGQDEAVLTRPAARNVEAYEYYWRGAEEMRADTPEANSTALAYFKRALAIDPDLIDAIVGVGAVHVNRYFYGWEGGFRNIGLADEQFRRALAIDPNYGPALRGLIRTVYEHKSSEEVLDICRDINITEHSGVSDLFAKAESYVLGGISHRALPLLRRVIELEPTNQGVLWWLVVANAWAMEYEDCIEDAETYFVRYGESPELHTWVAVSHQSLGNLEEAVVHYRRALGLFGDNPNFYTVSYAGPLFQKMGMEYLAEREYSRAISLLEPLLEAYPDNIRMASNLAILKGLAGDNQGFLELAEQLQSESTYEFTYGGGVVMGVLYGQMGYVEEAARMFCALADNGISDPTLLWHFYSLAEEELLDDERIKVCIERLAQLREDLDRRY